MFLESTGQTSCIKVQIFQSFHNLQVVSTVNINNRPYNDAKDKQLLPGELKIALAYCLLRLALLYYAPYAA